MSIAFSRECYAIDDHREPAAVQAEAAQTRPFRPLRVLLAEDTRAIQKLVAHVLERRGHTVEVVENGRQAVDLIASRQFDVVLMDVQMPVMGGFEAVAAIRQMRDPVKARLPTIALTLDGEGLDGQRCLSAGMDGYIRKPIVLAELIEFVEGLAATALSGPLDFHGRTEHA